MRSSEMRRGRRGAGKQQDGRRQVGCCTFGRELGCDRVDVRDGQKCIVRAVGVGRGRPSARATQRMGAHGGAAACTFQAVCSVGAAKPLPAHIPALSLLRRHGRGEAARIECGACRHGCMHRQSVKLEKVPAAAGCGGLRRKVKASRRAMFRRGRMSVCMCVCVLVCV